MKKIFCLGLIGILSFGTTSFVYAGNFAPVVQIDAAGSVENSSQYIVKFSTKQIKDNQEAYKIDLQVPVLEGVKDIEIQNMINTFLEKDALAFSQDIKEQGVKFAQDAKKQGWVVRPYVASTSYKVVYNQNNLASIVCNYLDYTGGAHSNFQIKTFNFDLTTGKQLTLKDIFSRNENYMSIINQEIENQIKLNPTKYFVEKEQSFYGISPDQPFGIEKDNLIIYFNPYEIAPYSTGAPEFKIPLSSFKEGVKTEFQMKKDSVKVMPKLISEKNEVLTSDIKIPVLKSLKDEKMQSEINKAFENRALDLKNQMMKDGKEALEDAKKYGYENRPYNLSIDYNISYNKKDIISITSTYYQYTGGAHGNTLTETLNINTKTGEKIELKDFFKQGVDYKKVITEEVRKQMTGDNKFYPNAAAELKMVSDDQSFYIEGGNIIIYYQPYEIAPYAAGICEFKIPSNVAKI